MTPLTRAAVPHTGQQAHRPSGANRFCAPQFAADIPTLAAGHLTHPPCGATGNAPHWLDTPPGEVRA